jgi:hypothetical protein
MEIFFRTLFSIIFILLNNPQTIKIMFDPRKIQILRFLNRPFFETDSKELDEIIVQVMFNRQRLERGEDPGFPYNQVKDPNGLAEQMLLDLERELALRN